VRFKIRKTSSGQYWFRVVAANGQVLAHSETYAVKASARQAIDNIKRNGRNAPVDDETGER